MGCIGSWNLILNFHLQWYWKNWSFKAWIQGRLAKSNQSIYRGEKSQIYESWDRQVYFMKHEQLSYNVDMIAWGHPKASVIGRHFLYGDHSHDWKIVATQLWAPIQQGREVGKYHINKIGRKGEGGLLITNWICHKANAWNRVFNPLKNSLLTKPHKFQRYMGSYDMLWKVPAYPKSIPHLLDHSSFADSVKLWGFCENFISLFSKGRFPDDHRRLS